MSDNTKLLFGIFCLMLTLVFLYTLTALGFNGNDSAFIILVLAVISLVTGLIFGILGILSSRKKIILCHTGEFADEASSLFLFRKQLNGFESLPIGADKKRCWQV
ncbi:MAG: hypothetical protein ACLSE4_03460 [Clostridium sp.]